MSEFECSNGHSMLPSKGPRCWCGARVARMDGLTDREIEARDKEFDRLREEKESDICEECEQPLEDHDDGECPRKFRED